ncbi:uncharacterized protein LOC111080762 [Drosophila obscura]|uniref:uncharacterized protein LOC111080762 n=1 Tax=Drosophila obscura TaxID=7282 RepID=UPI000BA01904|nr:uncharacterized protein LOC111080762 [Drosophila obscura]
MMFLLFIFCICIHIYTCGVDAHGPEKDPRIHERNDRPHHGRPHNMHRPPYKAFDWYNHYAMDDRPDEPPTEPPYDHVYGTTEAVLTGVAAEQQNRIELEKLETAARISKVEEWKKQLAAAPMPGKKDTIKFLFEVEQMAKNVLDARRIPHRRSPRHQSRRHRRRRH